LAHRFFLNVLTDADALITQVISAEQLWERALGLSVEKNHPAYDTLFVALAEREDTELVTYDIKVRRKFQDRAISPTRFLA